MQLDLTKVRASREHIERVLPAHALDTTRDDFRVAGDVHLAFDLEKEDDHVRLVGTLQAPLELSCSRCLEPLSWPIETSFDLRYVPQSANTGEDEREVVAEDLATTFYEGDSIDLTQLIREQFYLAMPMKPLCRPDCAGLCPECGANLNAGQCGCEHRWTDARMAALEQLLPKDSKQH